MDDITKDNWKDADLNVDSLWIIGERDKSGKHANGHYDMVSQEHHRFRADKEENRNHKADRTTEYMHILEKA